MFVNLDTRTASGGDWVRVRHDEHEGWVAASQVSCHRTPQQARQLIGGELEKVLAALGARNLKELATYVHPVKGLRFSPYIDIDPKHTVVLRASEVAAAESDRRQRRWGADDASGEPITATFNEYAKQFIFDHDFARAPERNFNEFGKQSTTRPNVWEVYPHAIVVELHVPGTKPESEGMDWASLLLVFEQHDSRWYLSALVHDRWSV